MSALQSFPNQPTASSSNSGGLKPRLILKVPQSSQSASLVPFSNVLPSAPPTAKKMQRMAFECKELGLSSDGLNVSEGKRKAVVSSNAFRKSQLLQQEAMHLEESSREQVILTLSHKGKEVIHNAADVDVEMGAPEELDTMTLDYPEEVPPPPVPVPTPPAPVWKAIDNWSYCEVSGLKTWFFEPLIKQDPSDNSSATWDENGLVQGAFNDLKEQMKHPSSDPPAPFSNSGLTQFIESLSMINLSSANIIDAQQDELLRAYQEYQALSQKLDHLETKNLHLKEQVSSRDDQLEEKDEELTRLKSFVRHFKGDVPSTEIRQLREVLEGQESEIDR
ncbi:hypothetical protein GYMLUDRAFT_240821 [Collybiopsis luxurians FD-317 M1]|nr:hypothetical protein GYMLUDRAFT_240821 [Collybiopsis luxurians FD-317 M1]